MKKALVLQHMNHDHPGRFLDWFAEDGIVPVPVRMFEGQEIPPLAGFDFMFVLGGAQDTWQEQQFPYLKAEKQAIREWVWDRAKPYFGVCLGHQLLATALGGEVALADEGEVGVLGVGISVLVEKAVSGCRAGHSKTVRVSRRPRDDDLHLPARHGRRARRSVGQSRRLGPG